MNIEPSVCILMSTFNGQKFIKEQIDSLLEQKGVELRIIIRDDGSNDDTISIISEYCSRYSNITLLKESNCGAEESFNRLCRYALLNENSNFYAFCDQDDVWDNDKLEIAIGKLKEYDPDRPNLYFSNLRVVDEDLVYLNNLYTPKEVNIARSKTLVQIFTFGCTCVFNRTALRYYCRPKVQLTFHDNWIYCICSYLGNVYYDIHGHIKYRQHRNNLSGNHSKGILLFTRIKRLLKGNLGHDYETMASQLLLFENEISTNDLSIIRKVSDYRKKIFSRVYLLFSKDYSTSNIIKNICISFRIITNSL